MLYLRSKAAIIGCIDTEYTNTSKHKKTSRINKDREQYDKWINIYRLTYLPQIIFFIHCTQAMIHEGIKSNIPCIVVENTSSEASNSVYYIPSSNNSILNTYLYSSMIIVLAEKCAVSRYSI